MARIAGVAGCTVSILSTLQTPGLPAANPLGARPGVTAAAISVPVGREVLPAVSGLADFVYDAGSREYISDEAILSDLSDQEDCGESASFGLEGYVTTGGETLTSLARRYSLDPAALAVLNGLGATAPLPSGTRISLYRGDITLYSPSRGETLEQIARKFGTDSLLLSVCNHLKSTTMDGTERVFIPQGILEREGEADLDAAPVSAIVIAAQPEKPQAPVSRGRKSRRGRFEKVINFDASMTWPVAGNLSSRFGWRNHPILNRTKFHAGIDISAPSGSPIRCVAPGRVIFSGWKGALGRTVVVRHANNLASIYAHCSQLGVEAGQTVTARQLIARTGRSGRATGSHLHFAMERGKTPVNPLKFLH